MWQYMLGVFVLYGPPLAPTRTLSTGECETLLRQLNPRHNTSCKSPGHGALQEKTLIVQIHLAFSATWYSLRQVKLSEEGLTLPGAYIASFMVLIKTVPV